MRANTSGRDPRATATDMILRALHNQEPSRTPETDQQRRFLALHMAPVCGTE